jgi:hypothetical protein
MHVTVYGGAIPDNPKTEALHGAREERVQSVVAWQQARCCYRRRRGHALFRAGREFQCVRVKCN